MIKKDKPLIGITVDYQTTKSYSDYPWYALRTHYADAVSASGGLPILIPYAAAAIPAYSQLIDGLIVSGGNFDIDPEYYKEQISSDKVSLNDKRTAFEIALTKEMLALNTPILGICGGHQLLNVILGGNLIQHIPDAISDALEHEQTTPKHLPSHEIKLMPNTLLSSIVKRDSYMVNSTHHQAVNKVGCDVVVNAVALDGVVEGIEYLKHKFCLGVQWHPEYCESEENRLIFKALIRMCTKQ